MSAHHAAAPADLPLGELIKNWTPPPLPPRAELRGEYCIVAPLDIAAHSECLFRANRRDHTHRNWTYLPYGPFHKLTDYQNWLAAECGGDDPLFFSVLDRRGQALGVASYLNIKPAAGSIEVGHINYAPPMQQTTLGTEAMYLLMKNVFALGYRRYEWKCNALNQRSRAAATRLGFTYEGTFRQMQVVKNRNRDTAWYSVIDQEWPRLAPAFQRWLRRDNFVDGRPRQSLAALTARALSGESI